MLVLQSRNVNDAYSSGMRHLTSSGVREMSRAGEVLVALSPVTTVYNRPAERVLFDSQRDANPFFHLMESVWMLAGRRDATWLDTWVRDFSSRFAEDDGNAHGAYGHRWRRHWERDQLVEAAGILRRDPSSRQAVIAMWDPAVDLGARKRDIPCNDLIMLRGRRDHTDEVWELDVTVLCRSNDAVWGAYGANAVHMSILAEVLAGLAGMRLGRYYQVSNNFHVYTEVAARVWPPMHYVDPYVTHEVEPRPIMADGFSVEHLLADCEAFCEGRQFSHPWLLEVVSPMRAAHAHFRAGNRSAALGSIRRVQASDWQLAGRQWMERRWLRQNRKIDEARPA